MADRRRAPRRERAPGIDLLYGRNAVIEAVRAGRRRARRLFVAGDAERQPRVGALLEAARARGVPVTRVTTDDLERMLGPVNHQGVALEASPYPYVSLDALLSEAGGRPILALDHVQDPQNLATLIRTAEASGAAGVVLPERRSAGVTPAVVNASAGAVELLPVALVANLSQALERCKARGYWAVALEAEEPSTDIYRTDIPEPAVLIVGSEGRGIAPLVLEHADLRVRLPMLGRIESLNAAVAGSIALYELLRRRMEREARSAGQGGA